MADEKQAKIDLFNEAIERFKKAETYWDENRQNFIEDKKFLNGEQWPEAIRESRASQNRPVLVVDKLNQYVNQVVNDGRQNRPTCKARPIDDYGDVEIAEVLNDILRHIQDRSNADQAYDCALENAAIGGFGFFRVLTEYAHEGTFNQEITIKRIRNSMSVLLDPSFKEADASDMRFAFIIDEMTKEDFKAEYPKAEMVDWKEDSSEYQDEWLNDEGVRVCEYYYIVSEKRKMHLMDDNTVATDEQYQGAIAEGIDVPNILETREIPYPVLKWLRMSGAEILEQKDQLGKFVPVVPVFGNECDIEGTVSYSGMVRMSKDPQRLYNYSRSAFAERVALTPKAPYIAADGQVDDYMDEWEDSNTGDYAVLRYKPMDVEGRMVPAPARQSAVDIPAGFAQDIQISEHDIQGALGMYNASLGEQSNEKSGKAILARQREGDVATFHYHDNLNRAIGFLGNILVDIIPKVYDSQRVMRILGEDGSTEQIGIDPNQAEAMRVNGEGQKIYNLNIGKYDVTMTAGASYTTKRAEAAEAMMQLTQGNPQLFGIIGDLMMRNMDWPGADEIADRLQLMLPPELQKGDDDSNDTPEVQQVKQQAQGMIDQMSQQMEQMGAALQELQAQNAELTDSKEIEAGKLQLQKMQAEQQAVVDKFESDIKAFEAETKRMKVVGDLEAQKMKSTTEAIQAASEMTENVGEITENVEIEIE